MINEKELIIDLTELLNDFYRLNDPSRKISGSDISGFHYKIKRLEKYIGKNKIQKSFYTFDHIEKNMEDSKNKILEILNEPQNQNRRYCIKIYIDQTMWYTLFTVYDCYDSFKDNINEDIKKLANTYSYKCELLFFY